MTHDPPVNRRRLLGAMGAFSAGTLSGCIGQPGRETNSGAGSTPAIAGNSIETSRRSPSPTEAPTPTETPSPTETPTATPERDELEYESPHVTLLSYGVDVPIDEFDGLPDRLETELEAASDGLLSPTAAWSRHFEVDRQRHDFCEVTDRFDYMDCEDYEHPDDIPRLWYYYNEDALEREAIEKAREASSTETDVAVVVTDLQTNGRGVYRGVHGDRTQRHAVTTVEGFMLGGWANGPSYTRMTLSVDELLDLVIHEIGHYYETGHREKGRACVMSHGRLANDDPLPFHFCEESLERIEEKL